jgi:Protein of unknown function (DUF3592)
MWVWLTVGLTLVIGIARGFWLYRASLTWPTSGGEITRIDIERRQRVGATARYYFCATFIYDFRDSTGYRLSGSWSKDFPSEEDAREFAKRELAIGKRVVVRYSPKNPAGLNGLELDSWTYSGDRPTSLFS